MAIFELTMIEDALQAFEETRREEEATGVAPGELTESFEARLTELREERAPWFLRTRNLALLGIGIAAVGALGTYGYLKAIRAI